MATLKQIYMLRYTTTGILNRATAAVMKQADYILTTEGAEVTNHVNRVLWAQQAVDDPESKARQLMTNLAVNGTIQAGYEPTAVDEGISDADIEYVVNVLIDTYATGA